MTLKEAEKLKIGDRVVWPEGANDCPRDEGTVIEDEFTRGTLCVKWDHPEAGERTYLHDEHAVKYIQVSA